jgi:hypothetical protein
MTAWWGRRTERLNRELDMCLCLRQAAPGSPHLRVNASLVSERARAGDVIVKGHLDASSTRDVLFYVVQIGQVVSAGGVGSV